MPFDQYFFNLGGTFMQFGLPLGLVKEEHPLQTESQMTHIPCPTALLPLACK